MSMYSEGWSPADAFALVNGNRDNNDGFCGGNGIVGLIALIIISGMYGFGGFGGGMNGMLPWLLMSGGYGGFGGFGSAGAGYQGALTRADLCSEFNFNGLENSVRGIQQGICDSTFALNNTMTNGFHGVDNAICNLGYQTQQGFNATQIAMMQAQNAIQTQNADCCCKNQIGQMQLGNTIERGFCDTNYNAATNTTAIIQNAHNDTDRVLAKLDAMEMSRKDETIADLRTKLAACGDQTTAQYIINQLTGIISPRAVPAYPAASPCGLGNWSPQVLAGNQWNNNCGCNNVPCNTCGCA